jgi:hypothetical protein
MFQCISIIFTQDDDSELMKNHRSRQESHGNRWKRKRYSGLGNLRIFSAASGRFLPERTGIGPEDTGKIRKFS